MVSMKYIIMILLLATIVNAQIADVAGLPDNAVNLDTFYGEVKAVYVDVAKQQSVYYEKNKRYFQGLPGTQAVDISTAKLSLFNRAVKPSDQKEDWQAFGLSDISTRGKYWCDVYDGPRGKGWVFRAAIIVDGNEYQMSINNGPETWMGTGFVKQVVDLAEKQ